MKVILTGNKKLYDRLAGSPKEGFVKVTTQLGTPIIYLNSFPSSQMWVVDVLSKVSILGDEFGYVTIDDYLEAL